VHVRSWQVAYRGLLPDQLLDELSVRAREQTWRETLAGRAGEHASAVTVAVRAGTIAGFCAVVTPSRDDDAASGMADGVAEIAALYVDPPAWRSGAGRALMQAALASLRAAGWREVTLWVLAANQRALAFYAASGFEPDGAAKMHHSSGRREVRLRTTLGPAPAP
jgi:ribosomal protein S18 acetylase RimI-like enzyme